MTNKCYFGDCRDSMRQMISNGVKVQMCVTSPPYFGLRDYGHDGQIGQEPTPEEFIANLVDVFRLVRELLADDGILFVNIGDSYNGSGKGVAGHNSLLGKVVSDAQATNRLTKIDGLKPKDLIGIPWMLAFALRADGWFLRQDIIWAKPNPMPESVTDRCTKSHEYIFLLSKSQKYYYDADAIAEPAQYGEQHANKSTSWGTDRKHPNKANVSNYAFIGDNHTCGKDKDGNYTRNKRSVWTVNTKPYSGAHFAVFPEELIEPCILAGSRIGDIVFDPFFGSGTTGQVSQNLGRKWIGCELNPEYEKLQNQRVAQSAIAF